MQLNRIAIGQVLLEKLLKWKSRKLRLPELEMLRKMVCVKA